MNSVELKQYIDDRNGKLNGSEAKFATDIKMHPQLDHIAYND